MRGMIALQNFRKNFAYLWKESKLSPLQLAALSGQDTATLFRLRDKELYNIRLSTAQAIAEAFNVTITDMNTRDLQAEGLQINHQTKGENQ